MDTTLMEPALDLDTLVRTHHAGVWRYLRLLGCTREEADDITQETFIVVMRAEFTHHTDEQTATFLRRTARNLFLHSKRKTRTRREVDIDAAEAVMRSNAEDGGDAYVEALKRCLDAMRGRTRLAVLAVYGDKLTTAQVADQMGLKENGLKTLLQRAREKLRDCVQRRMKP